MTDKKEKTTPSASIGVDGPILFKNNHDERTVRQYLSQQAATY